MGVRRVVTGHDIDGRAVFASDEVVEPITIELRPGLEFYRLWGGDEPPRFPSDGSQPPNHEQFPGVGGFRFMLFTVPPDSVTAPAGLDLEAARAERDRLLPGLARHMEPDNPGMHTTATIDYLYVLSGRVVLELDEGETREIGPGDSVVQNGTRHAWRNPFDEPCRMVVALVGAHHDSV